MDTERVTVDVPASLARELDAMRQEMLVEVLERGLRELKIERALARYVAGGVSFAAAAQLAGLTREDLTRQAYARGVQPAYSEQTVEEELG